MNKKLYGYCQLPGVSVDEANVLEITPSRLDLNGEPVDSIVNALVKGWFYERKNDPTISSLSDFDTLWTVLCELAQNSARYGCKEGESFSLSYENGGKETTFYLTQAQEFKGSSDVLKDSQSRLDVLMQASSNDPLEAFDDRVEKRDDNTFHANLGITMAQSYFDSLTYEDRTFVMVKRHG